MATSQQKSLFHDYEGFVEKFKPKKTTDDCYTPENVYEVIRDWACERYDLDPNMAMRPFFPGGDYMAEEYPDGCFVLDNPPFSIVTQICRFYQGGGVPFFLFAPALTTFKNIDGVCAVCVGASITYENGAEVTTSFLTNMEKDCIAMSAPSLFDAIKAADDVNRRKEHQQLPKYEYPDEVITAAKIEWYTKHHTDYRLGKDSVYITQMDAQKAFGKSIFGGGYLLSERAAAERAAAERAAAERAAAERAAVNRWKLSDKERRIQKMIS